ncbi:MAG: helix-turn-helix domain-containing protein, partial [Proteobacteria bacterium]|nr:helix-turn-helix domain-containing protein [Pseudomonadota bacterium]
HLSTHIIKAIEADRYEDLPGATYVVGYWRSYARLLGIDIEETIEVNKRNLNIVKAEPAGLDINRALGHKAKSGGLGGVLLLILLAAFAYYAWQQQFFGMLDGVVGGKDETATTQNGQPDQASDAVSLSPEPKQEQVLMPLKVEQDTPARALPESDSSSSSVATDKSNKAKVFSGQSESGLVLQADKEDKAVQEQAPRQDGQAGLVLAQITESSDTASSDSDTSSNILKAQTEPETKTKTTARSGSVSSQSGSQASEAASSPVASVTGMETMTLTLSKDSWLDIRDKTRTRLLYKTEKAGEKIDVTGVPPFYVYIGTPDGVSIHYRGKDVPFKTHKTGMFARFKLDDEMLESL